MKDDIYNFFNISKNSTQAEIKKAFRKKAKKSHPDTGKGSREEFEKASKFYKVLMNPLSRKKYDETGDMNDKKTRLYEPLEALAKTFEMVLQSHDHKTTPIFEEMAKIFRKEIKDSELSISKCSKANAEIQDVIDRIISEKKTNVFRNILLQKININAIIVLDLNEKIKSREEALEMLKNFKYRIDEKNKLENKFDSYGEQFAGFAKVIFEDMSFERRD